MALEVAMVAWPLSTGAIAVVVVLLVDRIIPRR
jgi:hypothetical protein